MWIDYRTGGGGSTSRLETSTIFVRARSPLTSRTAEARTPAHCATTSSTARFASPSTAGAVTQSSSTVPAQRTRARDARGWTRTVRRTAVGATRVQPRAGGTNPMRSYIAASVGAEAACARSAP